MIEYHGWKAFPAVAMGTSLLSGVQTLVSGGVGLGSLAPNIVCFGLLSGHGRGEGISGSKSGGRSRAGAAGSDWFGGAEEYLTALQTCVFFGKSLLVARGFDSAAAATVLLEGESTAGGGSGGSINSRVAGGGSVRQVDVWVFPPDGAGGAWSGTRSRGGGADSAMRLDVSDEESDELSGENEGGAPSARNWSSDSTVSLSLQLAYLYVEARRRSEASSATATGVQWRLRLLSYVEGVGDIETAERMLKETLRSARIPSSYSSVRVVVVEQLSLPLYQQLEREISSPPRGLRGASAEARRSADEAPARRCVIHRLIVSSFIYPYRSDKSLYASRRPGFSVLRSLSDPLQLCAVQNAVLHATTEFGTALLLLPLPALPLPDAVAIGGGSSYHGGAANEWVSMVSELGDGLPPTLLVHNPTAGVIATQI